MICISPNNLGGATYSQNPPTRLQFPEDYPCLLRLDHIDGFSSSESAPELDHALGKTNLSQSLVALILRKSLCGSRLGSAVSFSRRILQLLRLRAHRGVVDNLVVNGLVGGAQRRVKDGQKPQLRRYDDIATWLGRRGRGRHCGSKAQRAGDMQNAPGPSTAMAMGAGVTQTPDNYLSYLPR